MNIINFQLVTPERTVLTEELVSLTCPTTMGDITILPNHAPLVAQLVPGELKAKTTKDEFFLFVSGGFVEVKAKGQVTVLADAAEHNFEIDEQRALEAKQRAEKQMSEKKSDSEEYAAVAASLQKSLARLNFARKRANRKTPNINSPI